MATNRKTQEYRCKLWLPSGRTEELILKGTVHLSNNFQVYELANTLAIESTKLVMTEKSWQFLKEIQKLRDRYYTKYLKGLTVSSFYRTKNYNAKVKGASPNSAHLDARACDFTGIPQYQYEIITNWWREICASAGKTGGINYYDDNRIHITDFETKFGNSQFTIRDYRGKK